MYSIFHNREFPTVFSMQTDIKYIHIFSINIYGNSRAGKNNFYNSIREVPIKPAVRNKFITDFQN